MDDGQEIYLRELDLDKAERDIRADLLKLQGYYLRLIAAGLAPPGVNDQARDPHGRKYVADGLAHERLSIETRAASPLQEA